MQRITQEALRTQERLQEGIDCREKAIAELKEGVAKEQRAGDAARRHVKDLEMQIGLMQKGGASTDVSSLPCALPFPGNAWPA